MRLRHKDSGVRVANVGISGVRFSPESSLVLCSWHRDLQDLSLSVAAPRSPGAQAWGNQGLGAGHREPWGCGNLHRCHLDLHHRHGDPWALVSHLGSLG